MKTILKSKDAILYEIPPGKRSYEFCGNYYFLEFPWIYVLIYGLDQIFGTRVNVFGSFERVESTEQMIFYMPIGHNDCNGLCLRYEIREDEDPLEFILTSNLYFIGEMLNCLVQEKIDCFHFLNLWEEDVEYMKMFVDKHYSINTYLYFRLPVSLQNKTIQR